MAFLMAFTPCFALLNFRLLHRVCTCTVRTLAHRQRLVPTALDCFHQQLGPARCFNERRGGGVRIGQANTDSACSPAALRRAAAALSP